MSAGDEDMPSLHVERVKLSLVSCRREGFQAPHRIDRQYILESRLPRCLIAEDIALHAVHQRFYERFLEIIQDLIVLAYVHRFASLESDNRGNVEFTCPARLQPDRHVSQLRSKVLGEAVCPDFAGAIFRIRSSISLPRVQPSGGAESRRRSTSLESDCENLTMSSF